MYLSIYKRIEKYVIAKPAIPRYIWCFLEYDFPLPVRKRKRAADLSLAAHFTLAAAARVLHRFSLLARLVITRIERQRLTLIPIYTRNVRYDALYRWLSD